MNRHQRRAAKAENAAWAAGIGEVAQESGGMMDIRIVRRSDTPGLAIAALEGSREARRLVTAVTTLTNRVRSSGIGADAALCGCCDRHLARVPYAVVVAMLYRDDPSTSIVLGICAHCGPDLASIQKKAVVAFRRIFPDARDVVMQGHEGGRA
jgi:hypothetical protein